MKLIWHIIRKDIVRDRWALGIWTLLFVGQIALGIVLRHNDGTDQEWVMERQLGSMGLVFLQVIMAYILVARLVQADALIGTGVFWLTRPISAARLLAAKALGALLIFGVLPVLLLLPWWLYCAFGWRDLLWTAVETFSWQLLVIAPAFLVATLTDELGRVLLWTLLLVIGLFSWVVLLQSSLASSLVGPARSWNSGVMFTRLWLAAAILVTGALGIAAHQFLTRRLVRSVLLAVCGLGLIALIGQVWRWDWSKGFAIAGQPPTAAAPAGLADQIKLSVGTAKANTVSIRQRAGEITINVPIKAGGLPEATSLIGEDIDHSWHWAEGPTFTRDNYFGTGPFLGERYLRQRYSLPVPSEDPETKEWYQARHEETNAKRVARGLAPLRVTNPPPITDSVTMSAYAPLPPSIIARIRSEPPAYEARVQMVLTRPEIVLELPFRLGARAANESQTFQIRQLTPNDRPALVARIVSTVPSVRRNGLWQTASMQSHRWLLRDAIMAVNHASGEIKWLGNNRGSKNVLIGGVQIGWESLEFRPSTVVRNGKLVLKNEQWRDHTTLMLLSEREVARFTREVKTDKFEIAPTIVERIDGGPARMK